MKQFFLLLMTLTCIYVNATIRTVSNTPATLAQFSTIQAAVDASSSGDTIYVHGSPNVYASFTITNKQLVIIGPGWSPNKNLPLTVSVPGFTITGASSSNSEIQGLVVTSTIVINSNHPDNIRLIRNYFSNISLSINQGSTTFIGYLFEGNVFDNSVVDATSSSTYQNFLFQNNYFNDNACCRTANISSFANSVNVLFNHNLWFGTSNTVVRPCFAANCRFLTLTNNIFVKRDAATQNS